MLMLTCILSIVALLFASDLSASASRSHVGNAGREVQTAPSHSGRQQSMPSEPLTRAILIEAAAAKIKAVQLQDNGNATLPGNVTLSFSYFNAANAGFYRSYLADQTRLHAAARAPPSAA